MVIFHSFVNVYQMEKSHKIPLNYNFPWFSYGFPMVFLWSRTLFDQLFGPAPVQEKGVGLDSIPCQRPICGATMQGLEAFGSPGGKWSILNWAKLGNTQQNVFNCRRLPPVLRNSGKHSEQFTVVVSLYWFVLCHCLTYHLSAICSCDFNAFWRLKKHGKNAKSLSLPLGRSVWRKSGDGIGYAISNHPGTESAILNHDHVSV